MADETTKWQVVVSPKEENALWINPDARFSLSANPETIKEIHYTNGFKGNGVFLVVINGSGKWRMGRYWVKRDAIGISVAGEAFTIKATEKTPNCWLSKSPMN